jgi:hypothetical protein
VKNIFKKSKLLMTKRKNDQQDYFVERVMGKRVNNDNEDFE